MIHTYIIKNSHETPIKIESENEDDVIIEANGILTYTSVHDGLKPIFKNGKNWSISPLFLDKTCLSPPEELDIDWEKEGF